MSVYTNNASSSPEQARAYTAATLEVLGSRNPREVLEQTPQALGKAIDGLSPLELARPEGPGKWSIGQVLQHLTDCELVWGFRLRMVLAHDRPPITSFDQDLWAERLRYDQADPRTAIDELATLRRGNLRLLARAEPGDLKRVGIHAERGEESVEHMIRMEAGHDLIHLRQIDRIRKSMPGKR